MAPPPAHAECAQLPAATPSGVTAAASAPEQVADNAASNVAAATTPELHNQPGLNGLSACGTSGLTTVSVAHVCRGSCLCKWVFCCWLCSRTPTYFLAIFVKFQHC